MHTDKFLYFVQTEYIILTLEKYNYVEDDRENGTRPKRVIENYIRSRDM